MVKVWKLRKTPRTGIRPKFRLGCDFVEALLAINKRVITTAENNPIVLYYIGFKSQCQRENPEATSRSLHSVTGPHGFSPDSRADVTVYRSQPTPSACAL
jgi:hypothetical protein